MSRVLRFRLFPVACAVMLASASFAGFGPASMSSNASASGTPTIVPQPVDRTSLGGVRYRSFANTSSTEVLVQSGSSSAQQHRTWNKPSTTRVTVTYDATAQQLLTKVGDATTVKLAGYAPSLAINQFEIIIAERDSGAYVDLRNIVLDPVDTSVNNSLGNLTTNAPSAGGSTGATCTATGYCSWQYGGADLRAGFTLKADLVISGTFSTDAESDKVEINLYHVVPPGVTLNAVVTPVNDPTPTFTGTCTTNAGAVTVKVYGAVTKVMSGACVAGAFSLTSPSLGEGDYKAIASQTNTSSVTGYSAKRYFEVDDDDPEITLDAIPTPSNDTTPTFTGICSSEEEEHDDDDHHSSSGVPTVTITVTGPVSFVLTTPCDQDAYSATSSPLPSGTYTAVASQDDEHENEGTSVTRTFVIDGTAPVVTLNAVPSPTNDPTPTFSGTCTTGDGDVTITVTGASSVSTTTPCVAGTFSVSSPSLADGTSTATATQTDAAGNTGSSAPRSFVVDTTAPTVTLDPVPSPSNDRTPTFTGTCSPDDGDVTITITGPSPTTLTTSCTAGAFSVTSPSLDDGTSTATATQTDAAGNTGSSAPRSFVIEPAASTLVYTGDTTGTVGHFVTLSATLGETVGAAAIAGRQVSFTLGSGPSAQTVVATTNGVGAASTTALVANQNAGSLTVTASFAGDSMFGSSSDASPFALAEAATSLALTPPAPTMVTTSFTLRATLTTLVVSDTTTTVTPLAGRAVSFEVCKQPLGTCFTLAGTPTDATGVSTATSTFTGSFGDYIVVARYNGTTDPRYESSASTPEAWRVFSWLTQVINPSASGGEYRGAVLLGATLQFCCLAGPSFRPLNGRTISFYLMPSPTATNIATGTLIGSAVTGTDGRATIAYRMNTLPSPPLPGATLSFRVAYGGTPDGLFRAAQSPTFTKLIVKRATVSTISATRSAGRINGTATLREANLSYTTISGGVTSVVTITGAGIPSMIGAIQLFTSTSAFAGSFPVTTGATGSVVFSSIVSATATRARAVFNATNKYIVGTSPTITF